MAEDAAGSEPSFAFAGTEDELLDAGERGGEDGGNLSSSSPPLTLAQLDSKKFIACLIINVAIVLIILAIVYPFLTDYITYSQKTGFIGPGPLFGLLVLSALLMTFVTYNLLAFGQGGYKVVIFWAFILYGFFLIAWFLRLGIDFDDYLNGVQPDRYSSFINMATLVFALILLYFSFRHSLVVGFVMLLVVIWILALLYMTWFSADPNEAGG